MHDAQQLKGTPVAPSARPQRSRTSDPEFSLSEISNCPNYPIADVPLAPPEAYPANLDIHLRDELNRISLLVRAFLVRLEARNNSGITRTSTLPAACEAVLAEPFRWSDASDDDDSGSSVYLAEAARLEAHIVQRLRRTPDWVRGRLAAWELAKRFDLIPNLATVVPTHQPSLDDRPPADRDTLAMDIVLLAYLLARFPAYRMAIAAATLDEAASAAISTETALRILQPQVPGSEYRWQVFAQNGPVRALLHLSPAGVGREQFQLDAQTTAFLSGRSLPPDPVLASAVEIVHKWRPWDRVRLDESVVDQLRNLSNWWWKERGNNPFVAFFRGPSGTAFVEALQAFATWRDGDATSTLAWPIVVVDASRIPADGPWADLVRRAYREAILRRGVVLWLRTDALLANPTDGRMTELIAQAIRTRISTFLAGTTSWDPTEHFQLPGRFFVHVDMPVPSPSVRRSIWKMRLARENNPLAEDEGATDRATLDLLEAYELTQGEIEDAIATARGLALVAPRLDGERGAAQSAEYLVEACRRQSARRQVSFTQRVLARPMPDERDRPPKEVLRQRVVLPAAASIQLSELFDRIAHLGAVHHDLGFEQRLALGRGAIALFTGPPGTGKTLAATTIARLLKKDLYKVDAAAVASRFVGETERNLGRVFADVQGANAILFFDEADALFGKRGDVVNASDRWANLQISYLLQRIEEYSGAVILATNNKDSIDSAFFRRMQVMIEFPRPDAAGRLNILTGLLSGTRLAVADAAGNVATDEASLRAILKPIADRFDLTGGNLKNLALDAAFRAVAGSSTVPTVTVRELLLGVARELQKEGKPISMVTFGKDWYALVEKELSLGR